VKNLDHTKLFIALETAASGNVDIP